MNMRDIIDLCEGANARVIESDTIYHGTSVYAAASIISQNMITCGDHDDGPEGISLTSDYHVAAGFAKDVDERELEMDDMDGQAASLGPVPKGAIIMLRHSSIGNEYTLINHAWDGSDAEHEIRVRGQVIRDISDHLMRVQVSRSDIEWWIAEKTLLTAEYGETSPDGIAILQHGIPALRNLLKYAS